MSLIEIAALGSDPHVLEMHVPPVSWTSDASAPSSSADVLAPLACQRVCRCLKSSSRHSSCVPDILGFVNSKVYNIGPSLAFRCFDDVTVRNEYTQT